MKTLPQTYSGEAMVRKHTHKFKMETPEEAAERQLGMQLADRNITGRCRCGEMRAYPAQPTIEYGRMPIAAKNSNWATIR